MQFDYFYWFSQPSSFLSKFDLWAGYFFAGLLAVAIILIIGKRLAKNPVMKKMLGKIQGMILTLSIFGLIWFGFRYEATPIFARRYWLGLIAIAGLVWLGFILKYLLLNFRQELAEHAHQELKNKYIKGQK